MTNSVERQPTTPRDPLIGQQVGDYHILEAVGEGGMGVVYRAIQPVIKKRVAIKVLKPTAAKDATHVKRLVAEAEAVNAIGHRNIIDIFGLGILPDGRPYIVMEYLDGQALDAYLLEKGQRPLHEVLSLLNEIAAPLAAAHRAGVVHRDLKPSNVFLCRHEDARFVKLLDFGLAKRALGIDGTSAQTSTGTIAGTPDYMAPEQARGLPISVRTDIYALGVMAFEMTAGRLPFDGETPMDVMMAHVNSPVPSLVALVPGVSTAFDALVRRMLSKEPADRPQTVEEVRTALQGIAEGGAQRLTISHWQLPALKVHKPVQAHFPAEPSAPRKSLLDDESAQTLLRFEPQAPPPRRSVLPVVLGLVSLALVGAVVAIALQRRSSVGVSADAGVTALVRKPPPVVRASERDASAAVAPSVVVDAGAAAEAAEHRDVVEHRDVLRPRDPLTTQTLLLRVAKLEAKLKSSTAVGEDADPSALQHLARYRMQATTASTPTERLKVSHLLDTWERTFLKKH